MSGSLDLLLGGLELALHPTSLLIIACGVALGIFFGAMPGLSSVTAMAVLLPVTYGMSPEQAIFLFLAVYVGSQFGNSLPSVLLKLPGTPASVMVAVEGHAFQERGEGAKALGISLYSSMFGQIFSFVFVAILLLPLAEASVFFLHPEIFALSILGLSAASALVASSPVKGLVATAFGVALSTVGPDSTTGVPRFSFENLHLQGGLEPIPVILGLLVVSELIRQTADPPPTRIGPALRVKRVLPSRPDIKLVSRATWIGSIVGFIVGLIPGIGASAGSFIAYQQARNFAHDKQKFGGKGSLEGVAAADSANNSSTGAEFVPTLGLGIPGGPAMIMVLAALLLHGITPGPGLFQSEPGALEATVGGLLLATLFMGVMGYLVIRPAVRLVSVSKEAVCVIALVTSLVGAFALRHSLFDMWLVVVFGLIGYFMERSGYPVATAALGFILGGLVESSLRRGLISSFNDPVVFLSRPIVLITLSVAILLFAFSTWSSSRSRPAKKDTAQGVS